MPNITLRTATSLPVGVRVLHGLPATARLREIVAETLAANLPG